MRIHDVYRVTTCRPVRGYIMAAARLQLVTMYQTCDQLTVELDTGTSDIHYTIPCAMYSVNIIIIMSRPTGQGALSNDARLTYVCLSRTSGLSREQTTKTKIGTEVAHVTRDSDTTFKVKRSTCRGRGHIVAASRTVCYLLR